METARLKDGTEGVIWPRPRVAVSRVVCRFRNGKTGKTTKKMDRTRSPSSRTMQSPHVGVRGKSWKRDVK